MSAGILCGKQLNEERESCAIYGPGESRYVKNEAVSRAYRCTIDLMAASARVFGSVAPLHLSPNFPKPCVFPASSSPLARQILPPSRAKSLPLRAPNSSPSPSHAAPSHQILMFISLAHRLSVSQPPQNLAYLFFKSPQVI